MVSYGVTTLMLTLSSLPNLASRVSAGSTVRLFLTTLGWGGCAGSNAKDLLTCPFLSSPGLAKPIGLVEGPGGLGQGGVAATLQDGSQETEGKFEEFGYNAQLSDRISLDRTIPDYRPKR